MRLPFQGDGTARTIPVSALGTGHPVRVLLIDDDPDEASLTRSLLARVGDVQYEVDWVSSFSEGLDSIARNEHDAFLIDHNLGGQTGVQLVREARDAGSLAALIMLTGQRDRVTDISAMEAGATDFLTKGKADAAMLDRTLRYSITQAAMVSAVHRAHRQLAGLEELGRILVDDGPTPASIERIVDLIAKHFGFSQVAIYLADSHETLRLAGQRGYADPLTTLSTDDTIVVRVRRAGVPVFVPSVSPEQRAMSGDAELATELSVPFVVAGELFGLLNVASLAAHPMDHDDYAAVRVVGDRITAALELVQERLVTDERLSTARRELREVVWDGLAENLTDPETGAFGRASLQPLLEVAIASVGPDSTGSLGIMLAACRPSGPDSMRQLAEHARAAFANRPIVRFAETTLAVLFIRADLVTARSEAASLVALAQHASLDIWCGYGALAPGEGAAEPMAAAQAALAYAQRATPGTVIG